MTTGGEHPDAAVVRAYVQTIGISINRLLASTNRGLELLTSPDRGFGNLPWRVETLAVVRSWQMTDDLPPMPPPPADELHVRVLRWFGSVAVAGEAIAAAIEAEDSARMQAALDGLRPIIDAAKDMIERSANLRRRVNLAGGWTEAEA